MVILRHNSNQRGIKDLDQLQLKDFATKTVSRGKVTWFEGW